MLTICFAVNNKVHASAGYNNTVEIFSDSIIIKKQVKSKKHKVKLYTDSRNSVLFFTAGDSEKSWYQFFLFDVEGKLVKQLKLKGRQTTLLKNLAKGNYTFEIFKEDERIETGNLSVI